MADNPNGTQEARSERAAVMMTPAEKRAVRLLAAARDMSESDVVRAHMNWETIMADYEKMRPAVDQVAV